MIVCIIAGGSGTRLWPLSTSSYPKQFLSLEEGDRSLLQKTYDRVKDVADSVYLVSSAEIAEESVRQLPEIEDNMIIEPSRKGVANALYLAFRRFKNDGVSDHEPIFILWGDHVVNAQKVFTDYVTQAEEAIRGGCRLVQFGIVPNHPSNQLGYIKKGKPLNNGSAIFEIDSWKYQPDQETANEWYASGEYLWNAGYFMSTMDYVAGEIERESTDSSAEYKAIIGAKDDELDRVYNAQEGAILDHVLSERMKGAHVIACTFDWIDVGNYHDMHSISSLDDDDNHLVGNITKTDVSTSFIRNEIDIPVAVVGLDNVAVVVTKQGILVANMAQARKVGDVAKQIVAKEKK